MHLVNSLAKRDLSPCHRCGHLFICPELCTHTGLIQDSHWDLAETDAVSPLPALQFLCLGFPQRKGHFFLATHMTRTAVFGFCAVFCEMLLTSFNPMWKLSLGVRGFGMPRGSTDQFWGDSGCHAERGVVFLFLWYLEQYRLSIVSIFT